MATIPYVLIVDKPEVKVVKWETLTETNSDGQPYKFSGFYPDKCVQVIGAVGTGGHLKMEGSNTPNLDPSEVYGVLHDATEDEVDFTAVGIKQVLECPYYIRPKITAGTSVDLDCYLLMRRG